jgi:2-polyprenyl-3-methyl-5-hydroxy-6-metoxy-1,4-benzoquinol methylase/uncharacterized protein YbaR (Trm112 family)
MKYELLDLLRCPITKTKLEFKLIATHTKAYAHESIEEVKDGILFSETGFVFPIIDGIPRMLLESIYDYADFLKTNLPTYTEIIKKIQDNHFDILRYCQHKNKKTKQSFAFQWSFFNRAKKDTLWFDQQEDLCTVYTSELGKDAAFSQNKMVVDIGCGHGLMTSNIAAVSKLCIGVELSKAIEDAYRYNTKSNALYLQGDLEFLPFEVHQFDILYCSGVIHHTRNTHLSLLQIEPLLKPTGQLCLWLYHPRKDWIHNTILLVRRFLVKLPFQLSVVFILLFIYPFSFLFKRFIRKRTINRREEMISLLDQFTPEYREEIPEPIAINWLQKKQYSYIKITTTSKFGFAISATK